MDMLIKLHGDDWLAGAPPEDDAPFVLRKPIGPEHDVIGRWVAERFTGAWASEARCALANRPVTLFIACEGPAIAGFACYDATARGFVGPIGVAESARGRGIGAALLLACLHDMRSMGYGYAIAGLVRVPEFFQRVAGAIEIPDSSPGLYAGMLR